MTKSKQTEEYEWDEDNEFNNEFKTQNFGGYLPYNPYWDELY